MQAELFLVPPAAAAGSSAARIDHRTRESGRAGLRAAREALEAAARRAEERQARRLAGSGQHGARRAA